MLGPFDVAWSRFGDEVDPDQALEELRALPEMLQLLEDSYLDRDQVSAAARFADSSEFSAVLALIPRPLENMTVLDLGAGTGIASFAFDRSGVERVIALDPSFSPLTGLRSAAYSPRSTAVQRACAWGEALPIADHSIDVVYCRQVLHHAADLDHLVDECARVLRKGGLLVATREHVVRSRGERERFLRGHPVHQRTQGEWAYSVREYRRAMTRAGFRVLQTVRPWDSVVNAYPAVGTHGGIADHPREVLERHLGGLGGLIGRSRLARLAVRAVLNHRTPGRLYSFVALRR